jgi:ribosomal-protein-alanine N-acetyltransferase
MIQLFTERLIIRDPILDDLLDHHELMSNEKAMRYWQSSKTNNIEESKEQLLKIIEETNLINRKIYFLKIFNNKTNEHIGEVGYTVVNETPFGKIIGLGYALKEKFWGKGYATEAVKRLMEFAFEENNVYRISAGCLKENIGSEKVMKKCRMIKEADLKEYTLHENELKDRVEYRLLKNEWINNRV